MCLLGECVGACVCVPRDHRCVPAATSLPTHLPGRPFAGKSRVTILFRTTSVINLGGVARALRHCEVRPRRKARRSSKPAVAVAALPHLRPDPPHPPAFPTMTSPTLERSSGSAWRGVAGVYGAPHQLREGGGCAAGPRPGPQGRADDALRLYCYYHRP